ncbi:MAG: efflux RND transporter periplasmic adaptor subunit, partial [Balneolaceae bacterium]|nr:efflux RND transporter periplasmic adaptor subunit [Balneolaceae bacterium]
RITSPHNLDQSSSDFLAMNVSENPADNFVANFKPGMSATVDIKTNTVYDVVAVPIQSVTVRDFSSDSTAQADPSSMRGESGNNLGSQEDFRKVVFVNEDGTAIRKEVETGISDNAYMQIMSGLEAGEEVVTGSYRVLSRELEDGDKILASNEDT